MSPYIITTSEPFDAAVHTQRPAFTRRAVATLEEAYNNVPPSIRNALGLLDALLALPESGGTVGPLPDGTVIEVEPVSPYALLQRIEGRSHRDDWTPAAVVDAYNARQQST